MSETRGTGAGDQPRHRHRGAGRRWLAVVACALLVAAAGCGDDEDDTANGTDDGTEETTGEGSGDSDDGDDGGEGDDAATPTSVSVTLTEDAVDGLPDDLTAGVVDVTVADETEGAGGELSFSRVEEGTTEADFVAGLAAVFTGGAFPESFLDTAGVVDGGAIVVEEGEYFVWFDRAANLDRESTQDDIVVAPLTIGAGTDDATLPEADGTVTSTDYEFAVDLPAGDATINFVNESEAEFHHIVLVDFGTNDPTLVEENLPAILESEGDPSSLPEGIDGEQIDFEAGGSSVFGPGSAGTFEANLAEGSTYAALCFISDRVGGPPHAIQHQMYEVFQVEAA